MRDIVFLFGAGASHGAGNIIPETPPLGSQLYSALTTIYPDTWGALPTEIKDKFVSVGFEVGMGDLYERYSHVVAELMNQLAVYLIQFRPATGSSLYCKLIKFLHQHDLLVRTVVSTLNYDCILEFSVLAQGIGITYFDAGIGMELPVWKLHGSCNMFSKNVKASGILYSKGVVFEGGLEAYLDIGTVVEKAIVAQALAPAMCLYMRGKPVQISPSVISKVQQMWREQVAAANKVFCIGVNPWPEDGHIWDSLKLTQATLYFLGDQDAFKKWTSMHRSGPSEFLGTQFHTGYEQIERALVL